MLLNRSTSLLHFVAEWAGSSDVRCWSGFGCDSGSIWRLIDTVGWNPVQVGLCFFFFLCRILTYTRLVCALSSLEPRGFQVCNLVLNTSDHGHYIKFIMPRVRVPSRLFTLITKTCSN